MLEAIVVVKMNLYQEDEVGGEAIEGRGSLRDRPSRYNAMRIVNIGNPNLRAARASGLESSDHRVETSPLRQPLRSRRVRSV